MSGMGDDPIASEGRDGRKELAVSRALDKKELLLDITSRHVAKQDS